MAEYLEKQGVVLGSITKKFLELQVLLGKLMVAQTKGIEEEEQQKLCGEMAASKIEIENYAEVLKVYLQVKLLEEIEPLGSDWVPGIHFLSTSSALIDSILGLFSVCDRF